MRARALSVLIAAVALVPATALGGVLCSVPEDCADSSPCTDDLCMRSVCLHVPIDDVACDDGDVCTAEDRCANGNCRGLPVPGCGVPPTATATQPATPTSTPAPQDCDGDFDGDHSVTVDEILSMVNAALNGCPADECDGDFDSSGSITVDEILTAINNALSGCPMPFACTVTDLCDGTLDCVRSDTCDGFPTAAERSAMCAGTCAGLVLAECVCGNRSGCADEMESCEQECAGAAAQTQSACNAQCAARDSECAACRSQVPGNAAECEEECGAARACPAGCQSLVQTELNACLSECERATGDCVADGCCP